jgi:zinc transport system substrate-binding protein
MGEDLKEEEIVEGMQHEHDHDHDHDHEEGEEHDHDHEDEDHDHDEDHDEDHDHDHDEDHDHEDDHDGEHDHDHDHEHEDEYDEHVWLSLRNARKLTAAIAEALAGIDAANADAIRENAAAYDSKLQELDAKYTEAVENAAQKTVLFGDRFPFRYMTDDYGLTYYAAFTGCSAESEASFETIAFLAGKADELNLPAVLTIEGGNHKIADTVISASAKADRKVLTMNSMQSVTAEDVKNGMTYLSIMEENLNVLKEALN